MIRPRAPRFGLLAALLALAAQLAFGAAVPHPALGEPGFGIICHAGQDEGSLPARPGHHAPDCAICPLCLSLTAPAPTLGETPFVPVPRVRATLSPVVLPPATGPPAFAVAAAQPRGPPTLA